RAWDRTAEFWRVDRVYGRQRSRVHALLCPRGGKETCELFAAGGRLLHLSRLVVEPERASKNSWRHLDGGGSLFRSLENPRLPRAIVLRSPCGVDASEERAIAIGQGFAG